MFTLPCLDPMACEVNPASYVVMENLSISVLVKLPIVTIYSYFHKFDGFPHQDPQKRIRDFANASVSNQVADGRYLLTWFPTTLRGKAMDWNWSNPAGVFDTWVSLRVAFLQKYRAIIDQRQVLLALASLR